MIEEFGLKILMVPESDIWVPELEWEKKIKTIIPEARDFMIKYGLVDNI